MSPISVSKIQLEGFEATLVNNGLIELSIVPELGGKIASLRDLRNGRQWLWRHPRYPYKRVPHGSSYITEADTGGWDECFPSVAECEYPSAPFKGAKIQDHGEAWHQTAEFDLEERGKEVRLTTRWHGVNLPYMLKRTIAVLEGSTKIGVGYEAENTSEDAAVHFVWCIHPLLAIEPGMELLLPTAADFYVNGTAPDDLVSTREGLKYPFTANGLNLPTLPKIDSEIAIKLWSAPLPKNEGWATLRSKDGEFKMTWDVDEIPQIAAWLNLGKWAADGGTPYYNLGLEPCIGAQDSLNDAVNIYNMYAELKPRGKRNWNLEIELTA